MYRSPAIAKGRESSFTTAFRGDTLTWQTVAASYRDYIVTLRFLGESGPLWFAVALLAFSVLYALVRAAVESLPASKRRNGRSAGAAARITHAAVTAVILTIGVGSFRVRIVQPIGTSWMNMQLCCFTQYVVLFLAGLWVGNGNRLEKMSTQFGIGWLKLEIGAGVPAWFLIGALGGAVSGSMDSFVASMAGGRHWQAAAMAMWEAFFCVSFVIGLPVAYRERASTRVV